MAISQIKLPWGWGINRAKAQPLLDAFCGAPMLASLQDALQQRLPGTCEWIMDTPLVYAWLHGEPVFRISHTNNVSSDESSNIIQKLWIQGCPGSGRTVLAGYIVEQLIRRSHPLSGVCYYFAHLERHDGSLTTMFRTIIPQLAQQNKAAYEVFEGHVKGIIPVDDVDPSDSAFKPLNYLHMHELLYLFQEICNHFPTVRIVVDNVEALMGEQGNFIRFFTTHASSVVSVIVTSDITAQQQDMCGRWSWSPMVLRGRKKDISKWLQFDIKRRIANQPSLSNGREDALEMVEKYVLENSHGAWSWAKLELDYQLWKLQQGGPSSAMSKAPSGVIDPSSPYGPGPERYYGVFPYRRFLKRVISIYDERQKFILSRLIKWTSMLYELGQARMTITETCDALSLLLSRNGLLAAHHPASVTEEEAVSLCKPLIRKSLDGKMLEFSHATAYGFTVHHIKGNPKYDQFRSLCLEEGDNFDEIYQLCLSTLADPSLVWMPSTLNQDAAMIKQRERECPFYSYAAAYWTDMKGTTQGEFEDQKAAVLETGSATFASWVLEYCRRRFPKRFGFESDLAPELYGVLARGLLNSDLTALHVASALAMGRDCEKLLTPHVTINQSGTLGTPLWCALNLNASLGMGIEEPPWKRFRHYIKLLKVLIAHTIDCLLKHNANSGALVDGPEGYGKVSVATQALYVCAWLREPALWKRIMTGGDGAKLDRLFLDTLRSRNFTLHCESLDIRPVQMHMDEELDDFLNQVYTWILMYLDEDIPSEEAGDPLYHEIKVAVWENIDRDDLECREVMAGYR